MNGNPSKHTAFIKQQCRQLGFDYCGIAKAGFLEDDARRLEQWLGKGFQGMMQYMENYFELRTDPRKLLPGAASVITLLLNYYPEQQQQPDVPRISKYAYGKDYHEVIKSKLQVLLGSIRENIGAINGRGFVDSAPVLERSWAQRSGLGWIGKNGNLITRQQGSFFFIATLITDLPLEYDDPFAKDYCGSCTRCIDACPTEAILPDKVIDGSRCISYYTIELKEACMPEDANGKWDNWMFGCDACQDVCPWNRFSRPTGEKELMPLQQIMDFSIADWEELTEEAFKKIFTRSPLKRAKWKGIRKNLRFLYDGPVKEEQEKH